MIRFIVPTVAIIATLVAIAVASSRLPTSAQADPIFSVDAISDTSNTATAVGSIEACAAMFNNNVQDGDETGIDTIDVDIVIQAVNNPDGISGFQADLLYNQGILKVTAVDYNFILTTTGLPPALVVPPPPSISQSPSLS